MFPLMLHGRRQRDCASALADMLAVCRHPNGLKPAFCLSCGALILLGLLTRVATIPLIIDMLVTVATTVATLGIFLPAFIFVAMSGPLVARIRRSPTAGAFLDGVNVGALALMGVVTVELGNTALVDPTTLALAGASAVLLMQYRSNSVWLVLSGAASGLLLYR